MYIKFQIDDGSIIIQKFEESIVNCVDGMISYMINNMLVYKIHANEDGSEPKNNRGKLMMDKIYRAIESNLPIVDLTMDLMEVQYD